MQLAEPYGDGMVVVVRLWNEKHAEFRVLRLAPEGLVQSFDRRTGRVGGVGVAQPLPAPRKHALSAAVRSVRDRDRDVRDRRNDMRRGLATGLLAGLVLGLLVIGTPAGAYHTHFQYGCNDTWFNHDPVTRAECARLRLHRRRGGLPVGRRVLERQQRRRLAGRSSRGPEHARRGRGLLGLHVQVVVRASRDGRPLVPLPRVDAERPRPLHGSGLQGRSRRAEHDGRQGEHDVHGRVRGQRITSG